MLEFLREWVWVAPIGIFLAAVLGLALNFRKLVHLVPAKWKRVKSTQTLTADIVGRDEIIMELYSHFYKENTPIALTGIGGIGKTVLAEAFAKSHVNRSIFHDSILLPLGSESEMAKKLERIGAKLDVPANKNAAVYLGLVFDAMQASGKRYLLILDNADSATERKLALAHMPASEKISVLITSQYTDWRPPIKMVSIGPLSEKKAVELLAKESGLPVSADLRNLAVKTLECLPLPITIVGADLRTPNITLEGYDARFQKLLLETPNTTYEKSIYAAVNLAFDRLSDEAKSLIQVAAFMDSNDISDEYFIRGAAGIDAFDFEPLPEPLRTTCKNTDDIKAALRKCATHSLLSPTKWGDSDTYRIHRTTQMVLQDMLENEAAKIAGFTARLGRAQLVGNAQYDTQNWPYYHRLAPHAEKILFSAKSVEGDDEDLMGLFAHEMSIFLNQATGDLERVIRLRERVLPIVERFYGKCSSNYAATLSSLASVKDDLALTRTGTDRDMMEREAEATYLEAIEIKSKISGSELSLAYSHSQLGVYYLRGKRFSEAETQSKTALKLREIHGAESHLVASSLGNLGVCYSEWAKSETDAVKIKEYREKALDFNIRAWAPTRITLGEIHQDSALQANNLSAEYHEIGEFDKGLIFATRAAAILSLMVDRGEMSPSNPIVEWYKKSLEFTLSTLGRNPAKAPALIEAAKPEIIAQHEKWEAAKAAGEDYDPPPILPPELSA